MGDITRVIEGLDEISGYDCQQMSLFDNDVFIRGMAQEAAELLKSQQAEIDSLKAEQPKHGHWIIDEYEYLDCSCCGESYYTGCDSTKEAKHRLETGDVYKFCPYCGARMDGEQE